MLKKRRACDKAVESLTNLFGRAIGLSFYKRGKLLHYMLGGGTTVVGGLARANDAYYLAAVEVGGTFII